MKAALYLFTVLALLATTSVLTASAAYATTPTKISNLFCFKDLRVSMDGQQIGFTGGPGRGALTDPTIAASGIGVNGETHDEYFWWKPVSGTGKAKIICENCEVRLSAGQVYAGRLVLEAVGMGAPGTFVGTGRSVGGLGTLRNVHIVYSWWDDAQANAWCGAHGYFPVGYRWEGKIHVDPAR